MGLPALDEIRNALLEYLDFFFWVGRGNKMLMSSQKSVPVPMLPCHLSWEWGGKSLPPIFRCDIIFLVEISVVIDTSYFQIKSKKKIPFHTFYNFCSFIFAIFAYTCHLFIYMNSVNINLHKIKQNNWKINHHSTPLRICHNAADRVLTYGYFKSVCIDFCSLITTSTRTLASDLDALWYAYSHVHLMHIW